MADTVICDEILVTLLERGPIVVRSDGEFLRSLGCGTQSAKKSALSSLIAAGKVLRCRPAPQSCSDSGQPITFYGLG